MKTKIIKETPKFNPVTLEITFESREEIEFLANLIGKMSDFQAEKITGMQIPSPTFLTTLYDALDSI